MELTFFKRKQLNDYLNALADFRFSLVQGGPDAARITQYTVVLDDPDGGGTPMTDGQALHYLEVAADDQLEKVLNAMRFIRVLRKSEREDLEAKYEGAVNERKGVFEGLQEAVRRGHAGPRKSELLTKAYLAGRAQGKVEPGSGEAIDDKTLADYDVGARGAEVIGAIADQGVNRLIDLLAEAATDDPLVDPGGKGARAFTSADKVLFLFGELLARAYMAGRAEGKVDPGPDKHGEEADEEGGSIPTPVESLREEAIRRLTQERKGEVVRDGDDQEARYCLESAGDILEDVLTQAYTAGRSDEQQLHRD